MIERYTLGRVTLAKTENSSLQGAGIVECENGEFVRYEDYLNQLNAIKSELQQSWEKADYDHNDTKLSCHEGERDAYDWALQQIPRPE